MPLCRWSQRCFSRGATGNFVDLLRIRVRAGRGGDGVASFDRCIQYPKGRASGGDGGYGGNVVIVTDPSLDSLNHLPKLVVAKNGGAGGNNYKKGAVGRDAIIKVPPGTEIYKVATDDFEPAALTECHHASNDNGLEVEYCDDFVMVDGPEPQEAMKDSDAEDHSDHLWPTNPKVKPGERVIVARGGRGGKGNYAFGTNNHNCEAGSEGEELLIEMNLKSIADVGLVGLPNAGKSSFLRAVSGAHPKIASYPFTTLNPYIGIIEYLDGGRISVADIPGLIAGAHENRGLGHRFLKHITKSQLLALVVDFSHPEPHRDVETLIKELDHFQPNLSSRCKMVIANKADLLDGPALLSRMDVCRQLRPHLELWPISVLHSLAITRVTQRMRELAQQLSSNSSLLPPLNKR